MHEFYRPSGHKTAAALAIIPAAAVASAILAPFYAALSLYIPLIYANTFLVAGYGALVGFVAGKTAKATITLSPPLAGLLALLGGWIGFALSWACWLELFYEHGNGFANTSAEEVARFVLDPRLWIGILFDPEEFKYFVEPIYERGLWTIGKSNSVIRGLPLAGVWVVEFGIFSLSAGIAASTQAGYPYSAEAGAFLKVEPELPRGAALPAEKSALDDVVRDILLAKLDYLATAPQVERGEPGFYVTLRSHDGSPWGTADVTIVSKKGKKTEKRSLARYALLPNNAMTAIRQRLG
ncbi:MAG: hypothetical protein LBO66_00590 [Deltaproteobacteria bacterium]|jgi:hypothetical protein|nr:hypothetical protein [Deltaproteobacteria bacterium]